MRLLVVAIGERMPAWVNEGFADYAVRIRRKYRFELIEVRPERRTGRTAAQCMSAEAARIEAVLSENTRRVALDEEGSDATSRQFARMLDGWLAEGRDTAFLIGGPDGLDPGLKARAELRLRLSSLTLPHALVRVLLAEQLYRAASILDNHPYHRD